MREKYLPVGSICKINKIDKELMIIGYLPIKDENTIFDYSGCFFPEGVISSERILAFNHSDIKKVIQIGRETDETKKYIEFIKGIDPNKLNLNKTTTQTIQTPTFERLDI